MGKSYDRTGMALVIAGAGYFIYKKFKDSRGGIISPMQTLANPLNLVSPDSTDSPGIPEKAISPLDNQLVLRDEQGFQTTSYKIPFEDLTPYERRNISKNRFLINKTGTLEIGWQAPIKKKIRRKTQRSIQSYDRFADRVIRPRSKFITTGSGGAQIPTSAWSGEGTSSSKRSRKIRRYKTGDRITTYKGTSTQIAVGKAVDRVKSRTKKLRSRIKKVSSKMRSLASRYKKKLRRKRKRR